MEREARGWTPAELAERSGVSRAMISNVETGKSSPTAMLLGKLSGAFRNHDVHSACTSQG